MAYEATLIEENEDPLVTVAKPFLQRHKKGVNRMNVVARIIIAVLVVVTCGLTLNKEEPKKICAACPVQPPRNYNHTFLRKLEILYKCAAMTVVEAHLTKYCVKNLQHYEIHSTYREGVLHIDLS